MNVKSYRIEKRPTTWRVHYKPELIEGEQDPMRPLAVNPRIFTCPSNMHGTLWFRCENLSEVRTVVAALRREGYWRQGDDRRTHWSIRDRDYLRRLTSKMPRVGTAAKDLIEGLKESSFEDQSDRIDTARVLVRVLLRTLDADGLGGCLLCCS